MLCLLYYASRLSCICYPYIDNRCITVHTNPRYMPENSAMEGVIILPLTLYCLFGLQAPIQSMAVETGLQLMLEDVEDE